MQKTKMYFRSILMLAMLLVLTTGCRVKDSEPANESGLSNAEVTSFFPSDGIDDNGFLTGIKATDHVELFNYRAMPVPSDVHTVPEHVIQREIDVMLDFFATEALVTDRPVVFGDTVNIHFVGSVDGVEFAGGSTDPTGMDVIIGVTNFIDDFLFQLIGGMPGETINVEVTFPDNYHAMDLRGKDALFVTRINYIVDFAAPDLTDEFIEANLSIFYGWTTVQEMLDEMYSEFQTNSIRQYIYQYLSNEMYVKSMPDELMRYQELVTLDYFGELAKQYAMELEDFIILYMGLEGVDELMELEYERNFKEASFVLIVQAIAEDAAISVSDADLAEYFGTGDLSMFEEVYGMPFLKQIVLAQMVMDYVAENAVLQ
ncbi:MAG: FKBP-type peptidyl-prolyl cis-trans isomerase [Defluviitaleaceae bacterium]|nr:FKBP-type peptidyl-prolyl cis-trans isomerase [Defluviitaleaceae bacterium]MCL2837151.1 FKBP-type peptidyl-prolyl cis-trans isomerase [Defluviitaleaceae bacterium]